MAIFTRMGSPVKVLARCHPKKVDRGEPWFLCEYEDGKKREVSLSDLRADGGIDEIYDSARYPFTHSEKEK